MCTSPILGTTRSKTRAQKYILKKGCSSSTPDLNTLHGTAASHRDEGEKIRRANTDIASTKHMRYTEGHSALDINSIRQTCSTKSLTCDGEESEKTTSHLISTLKDLKQQRDLKQGKRSKDLTLIDAKIPNSVFVQGIRALEDARVSTQLTKVVRKRCHKLGLQPFVQLERVENFNLPTKSSIKSYLLMDDDVDVFAKESDDVDVYAEKSDDADVFAKDSDDDDVFAKNSDEVDVFAKESDDVDIFAKDSDDEDVFAKDSDDIGEFSTSHYKSSQDFHGFTNSESEIAYEKLNRRKLNTHEYAKSEEEEEFCGSSSVEINIATSLSQTCNEFYKNYIEIDSKSSTEPNREAIEKLVVGIVNDETEQRREILKARKVDNPTVRSELPVVTIKKETIENITDKKRETGSSTVVSVQAGCGFLTAGGRSLNVSATALMKAVRVYAQESEKVKIDADMTAAEELENNKVQNYKILPRIRKSSTVVKPLVDVKTQPILDVRKEIGTFGFTTAAGRDSNISEDALQKALYDQIPCDEIITDTEPDLHNSESINFDDFHDTAANNRQEVEDESKFTGIQKLNTTPIVAKTTIEKVKKILSIDPSENTKKSCNVSMDVGKNSNFGSTAGPGRNCKVSETALQKVEGQHKKDQLPCEEKINRTSGNIAKSSTTRIVTKKPEGVVGFTTGRGCKLKMSESALQKAQALYDQIPCDEIITDTEPDMDNIESLNFDDFIHPVDITANTRKGLEDQTKFMDIPKCKSLPTLAAPKFSIKVAETTIEKVGTIFVEIDPFEKMETSPDLALKIGKNERSFTSRGFELKRSEIALPKANDEIPSEEIDSHAESNFYESLNYDDFVDPADTVLNIKEKLEDNTESTDIQKLKTLPSLTTPKSSINVTQTAQTRRISPENDSSKNMKKSPELASRVGKNESSDFTFTTGRGEKLKVSEAALQKAKALNEEIFCDKMMIDTEADLNNMESLNFDDFIDPMIETVESKKRKFAENDDETPSRRESFGRKRGRFVNDLPGRKLFDDKDQNEDESLTVVDNTSQLEIFGSKLNVDETLFQTVSPEQIKEEVDASAAAFLEDEASNDSSWQFGDNKVKETKIVNRKLEAQLSATTLVERSEDTKSDGDKVSEVPDIQPESIPDDLTFDSQFSQDSPVVDHFRETKKIMEGRIGMIYKQEEAIRAKRRNKPKACNGLLYERRTTNMASRISLIQYAEGHPPKPRNVAGHAGCVTASSAALFTFNCADFYG